MKFRLKLSSIAVILIVAVTVGATGYFLLHRSRYTERLKLDSQLYQVVKVIDGDTIKVKIGNKVETIRLLGINTPEVENPYRHQECFGPQASKEAKKVLAGKSVYLLPDPSAPDRGKYHRLLRYVFLPNGMFINAKLIKEGYAFSYIYQPIQFMGYFNSLEAEARKNRLGLWSGECDYYSKFKK